MKMLILIFVVFCPALFAQPFVFEKRDLSAPISLAPYKSYFRTDKKLDIENIRQLSFSETQEKASYGNTLWIRIEVEKQKDDLRTTQYYISSFDSCDSVQFYIFKGEKEFLRTKPIGSLEPFANRTVKTKDLAFEFELPERGIYQIYLKIENLYELNPNFFISNHEAYEEQARFSYLIFGLFFGALLVMILYHLLLFLRLKELVVALYSGYLICLLIMFINLSGLGIEYFWQSDEQHYILEFSTKLCGIFLIQFTREFLMINKYGPLLSKIMNRVTLVYAILPAFEIYFGSSAFLANISLVFGLVIVSFIASAIFIALKSGYNPAIPFALSWGLFLLCVIVEIIAALGIIEQTSFTLYSLHAGAFCQMVLLSLASAERQEAAQKTIQELSERRANELEIMVSERTREIKRILDKVNVGFFMLDRSLKIQGGYSSECPNLFGKNFREREHIIDILAIDEEQKIGLNLALEQVFDDALPDRVAIKSVPKYLYLANIVIDISAAVIRDDSGHLDLLLITAKDATKQIKAEKQKSIDDTILTIFKQRTAFIRFMEEFRYSIEQCYSAISHNEEQNLRSHLHTLKGNSYMFNLTDIGVYIHKLEDREEIRTEDIAHLHSIFKDFVQINLSQIGISFEGINQEICQIDRKLVDNFITNSQKETNIENLRSSLDNFCMQLIKKSFFELLGPAASFVDQLCETFHRNVDLIILHSDTRIVPQVIEPFTKNLAHFLRNSFDHGFVAEKNRQSHGKPPRGKIVIDIKESAAGIELIFEDDGYGIDCEKLKAVTVKENLATEEIVKTMDEQSVLGLIFLPKISTAQEISEMSGRGYGMAAVKKDVEQSGGRIVVESTLYQGTRFRIFLPY